MRIRKQIQLKLVVNQNQRYLRDQCPVGLENNVWIGVSYSGAKEDLIKRILKFQNYPSLLEKIRNRAKRNYQFLTSLSPDDIPPSTYLWIQDNYPRINKSAFETYSEHKRQGLAGQQEKAHRLFLRKKVLNVKVLKQDNVTFVKGMVKKIIWSNIKACNFKIC